MDRSSHAIQLPAVRQFSAHRVFPNVSGTFLVETCLNCTLADYTTSAGNRFRLYPIQPNDHEKEKT